MSNINKAIHRWKEVFLLTLTIRATLFILSLTLVGFNFEKALTSWIRWDGPHYINIAQNGYQTTGEQALLIVFYPFYPLLIKLLAFITTDYIISSLIVSISFSLVAAIFLYELTLLDFSKRTALLAVWFLNIFPTSYFLQASYTESVFLATSLVTVYFFRVNHFIKAALAGTLTTAIRFNGLLLLPTLIWETKSYQSLITILLAPVGFLFYLFINYFKFGDALYFTQPLSNNWFKKIAWPHEGIQNMFYNLKPLSHPEFYVFFSEILAVIIIAFLTFAVYLKVRKSYGVYMFVNLLLLVSTNYILSTPRYALILFPIYIVLGLIRNNLIIVVISLVFSLLMSYLCFLYLQGKWAF